MVTPKFKLIIFTKTGQSKNYQQNQSAKLFLNLAARTILMVKLSVVIITLNEEKNIRRCLESVLDIADDIVIIDSNSIDKTKEISESLGARVIQHKFEGYVKQKNFSKKR